MFHGPRRTVWAVLAAIASVLAGLYLLDTQSASASSVFNPLLQEADLDPEPVSPDLTGRDLGQEPL